MKKILITLCVLFILSSIMPMSYAEDNGYIENPGIAEDPPVDDMMIYNFDTMTVEELLSLRESIDHYLSEKGYSIDTETETVYFDLERTSKGKEVSDLQERLKELGYYEGLISGKYDSETQKAMKLFEKANNLENDGIASREDQVILFSSSAIGKQIQVEEKKELSPTPTEDPALAEYVLIDYEKAARYPDECLNQKVLVKGKVLQVMGSRKYGFTLRISLLGSSDVVYVTMTDDPGFNILEKDNLYIYGRLNGMKTYKSVLKQQITIPFVKADIVMLR